MIDRQTGTTLKVGTDGTAGPYIIVDVRQLDAVTKLLNHNRIPYSVDKDAIRLDGATVSSVVNLGADGDVERVQQILDAAEDDDDDEDKEREIARLRTTATRAIATASLELLPSVFGIRINLSDIFPKKRAERRKSLEERKTALVKELTDARIDPVMFDVLLSNELDRRLKMVFGTVFLLLTILFTAASFIIVICDSIYEWKISDIAITALIIETPIQFIGLLYIIARNLFPGDAATKGT